MARQWWTPNTWTFELFARSREQCVVYLVMSGFSPTGKGFQLIFRRPAISLAEIVWRWSLGVAACLLGIAFVTEYVNSLPVTTVDRLLLGTQQPALILRALRRIFHGSGFRFTEATIVLTICMTAGWIVVASLGRVATLKTIIEELGVSSRATKTRRSNSSLMALNFLRSAVSLAAVVAAIGAVLIASGVWASTHMSVAAAARFWLLLLVLIWLAWIILNWFLSVAGIFVVADGASALTATANAVHWYRVQIGSVIAAGIWFGFAHCGAFIVACGAAFAVLSMATVLTPGPTLFLELLIVAVYCAAADFLYIGRLAAYVSILRSEEIADRISWNGAPLPGRGSDAVDQSEVILSDIPLLAT